MTPAAVVGLTASTIDDTCQICHSRPARPDGAICWVCMGSEASDPVPMVETSTNVYVGEIICPKCKKPHDGFLINGRGKTKTCKECIVARRKATWTKNKEQHKHKRTYGAKVVSAPEGKGKPVALPCAEIMVSVEIKEDLDKNRFLLIDFTERPELLDLLKKMAFQNFRTPEAQILYLISL